MLNVLANVLANSSTVRRSVFGLQTSDLAKLAGTTAWSRLRARALPVVVLVVAAMLAWSTNAGAQVRFGSVLGIVTDPSGATVGGATVKLTNLGTNETRTTQTSGSGTYAFPNLIAGTYRVEVEMAGFKHFTQDRVEVQVDLATRVDASMQVGQRHRKCGRYERSASITDGQCVSGHDHQSAGGREYPSKRTKREQHAHAGAGRRGAGWHLRRCGFEPVWRR